MGEAMAQRLNVINPHDKVEQLRAEFARDAASGSGVAESPAGEAADHASGSSDPSAGVSPVKDAVGRDAGPAAKPPLTQQSLIDRALDPARTPVQKALLEKAIDAIRTVYDPEIPVNIYDLGLIYDIDVKDDLSIDVIMTLTAPGCPVAGSILNEVHSKLQNIETVKSVDVQLTFDPPWTKDRMSEEALLELGLI